MIADRVFDELDTTEVIHEELISPIIQSVMKGINGQYIQFMCIICVLALRLACSERIGAYSIAD